MQSKLGKGESNMNKNEILEKSRHENKNFGEYETTVMKNAYVLSVNVGIIVCFIFYFLENQNSTYFIIWLTINATLEIFQAIKLKKTLNILLSIAFIIALGLMLATYLSDKGIY